MDKETLGERCITSARMLSAVLGVEGRLAVQPMDGISKAFGIIYRSVWKQPCLL